MSFTFTRRPGASVTTFEFATAGRIVFGEGCAASVPAWAGTYGASALVVTGREAARAEWLVDALQQQGADVVLLCVDGEPDLAFVSGGAHLARRRSIDVVVGLGGAARSTRRRRSRRWRPTPATRSTTSRSLVPARPRQRSPSAHRDPDDGRHRVRSDAGTRS